MAKESAFTESEKAAMKARAKEARDFKKLSGEEQIRIKLEELSQEERDLAWAVHELVLSTAPELKPRTWYGMPAYYVDNKIVCFFQAGSKFESRYSTFGFQDAANLDDGAFWPTVFAVTAWNDDVKKEITRLVTKAIS